MMHTSLPAEILALLATEKQYNQKLILINRSLDATGGSDFRELMTTFKEISDAFLESIDPSADYETREENLWARNEVMGIFFETLCRHLELYMAHHEQHQITPSLQKLLLVPLQRAISYETALETALQSSHLEANHQEEITTQLSLIRANLSEFKSDFEKVHQVVKAPLFSSIASPAGAAAMPDTEGLDLPSPKTQSRARSVYDFFANYKVGDVTRLIADVSVSTTTSVAQTVLSLVSSKPEEQSFDDEDFEVVEAPSPRG